MNPTRPDRKEKTQLRMETEMSKRSKTRGRSTPPASTSGKSPSEQPELPTLAEVLNGVANQIRSEVGEVYFLESGRPQKMDKEALTDTWAEAGERKQKVALMRITRAICSFQDALIESDPIARKKRKLQRYLEEVERLNREILEAGGSVDE